MVRTVSVMLGLLLVAGCGTDYGTVARGVKGKAVPVRVAVDERFSLAVPDQPGVGDAWELRDEGDTALISFIEDEQESESDAPGSAGVRHFIFEAKKAGRTAVRLYNCWRCQGTPGTAEERRNSWEAVFSVTVLS